MAEPLIERNEVVRLLLSVYDVNETLLRIEKLLREDDGEEEEEADES